MMNLSQDPISVVSAQLARASAQLRARADALDSMLAGLQPGSDWVDATQVSAGPDQAYAGRLVYAGVPGTGAPESRTAWSVFRRTEAGWLEQSGARYAGADGTPTTPGSRLELWANPPTEPIGRAE